MSRSRGGDRSNWIWRHSEPLPAGPAVIVDVDGVISDGSNRQHHLRGPRRDWKSFFADAHLDDPVAGSIELLARFDVDTAVVLLTARPHTILEPTLRWLLEHEFRWELLIMRHRSDGGLSSPEFKRRSLGELRHHGFEIHLAIDDDPRNVDMFRAEGVSTLYFHSGYYE